MFIKVIAMYRDEAAKILVASGYAVKLSKRRKTGKDGRPLRQWEYGLEITEDSDTETEDDDE